jgi:hypothetical protein
MLGATGWWAMVWVRIGKMPKFMGFLRILAEGVAFEYEVLE